VLESDKHWWPQAEAMVGYFNAYELSGEQLFLERALGSWEFIKKYIIDQKLGEWYWSVDAKGLPQTGKEKAGFWKCPYHNGRACMELMRRIDYTLKSNN
jgi:mannobiose 2-epimerase